MQSLTSSDHRRKRGGADYHAMPPPPPPPLSSSSSVSSSSSSLSSSSFMLMSRSVLSHELHPLYLSFINLEFEIFMLLLLPMMKPDHHHQQQQVQNTNHRASNWNKTPSSSSLSSQLKSGSSDSTAAHSNKVSCLLQLIRTQHEQAVKTGAFTPVRDAWKIPMQFSSISSSSATASSSTPNSNVNNKHTTHPLLKYVSELLMHCMERKLLQQRNRSRGSDRTKKVNTQQEHYHEEEQQNRLLSICNCFLLVLFPLDDVKLLKSKEPDVLLEGMERLGGGVSGGGGGSDNASNGGGGGDVVSSLLQHMNHSELTDYFSSVISISMTKSCILSLLFRNVECSSNDLMSTTQPQRNDPQQKEEEKQGMEYESTIHPKHPMSSSSHMLCNNVKQLKSVESLLHELLHPKYCKKRIDTSRGGGANVDINGDGDEGGGEGNIKSSTPMKQSETMTKTIQSQFHDMFHINQIDVYLTQLKQVINEMKKQIVFHHLCSNQLVQEVQKMKNELQSSERLVPSSQISFINEERKQKYFQSQENDKEKCGDEVIDQGQGVGNDLTTTSSVCDSASLPPQRLNIIIQQEQEQTLPPPPPVSMMTIQNSKHQPTTAAGMRLLATKLIKLCSSSFTFSTTTTTSHLKINQSTKEILNEEEKKVLLKLERLLFHLGAPTTSCELGTLRSPLHLVIRNFKGLLRLEAVKLLLSAGASLQVRDQGGNNPLHELASSLTSTSSSSSTSSSTTRVGHTLSVAKLMIESIITVDDRKQNECSSRYASNTENKQVSYVLNQRNLAGETPLFILCKYSSIKKKTTQRRPVSETTMSSSSSSSLPSSASSIRCLLASLFIDFGSDPLLTDTKRGRNCLHAAVNSNQSDMVAMLFSRSSSPMSSMRGTNTNTEGDSDVDVDHFDNSSQNIENELLKEGFQTELMKTREIIIEEREEEGEEGEGGEEGCKLRTGSKNKGDIKIPSPYNSCFKIDSFDMLVSKTLSGQTVLHIACLNKNVTLVNQLLKLAIESVAKKLVTNTINNNTTTTTTTSSTSPYDNKVASYDLQVRLHRSFYQCIANGDGCFHEDVLTIAKRLNDSKTISLLTNYYDQYCSCPPRMMKARLDGGGGVDTKSSLSATPAIVVDEGCHAVEMDTVHAYTLEREAYLKQYKTDEDKVEVPPSTMEPQQQQQQHMDDIETCSSSFLEMSTRISKKHIANHKATSSSTSSSSVTVLPTAAQLSKNKHSKYKEMARTGHKMKESRPSTQQKLQPQKQQPLAQQKEQYQKQQEQQLGYPQQRHGMTLKEELLSMKVPTTQKEDKELLNEETKSLLQHIFPHSSQSMLTEENPQINHLLQTSCKEFTTKDDDEEEGGTGRRLKHHLKYDMTPSSRYFASRPDLRSRSSAQERKRQYQQQQQYEQQLLQEQQREQQQRIDKLFDSNDVHDETIGHEESKSGNDDDDDDVMMTTVTNDDTMFKQSPSLPASTLQTSRTSSTSQRPNSSFRSKLAIKTAKAVPLIERENKRFREKLLKIYERKSEYPTTKTQTSSNASSCGGSNSHVYDYAKQKQNLKKLFKSDIIYENDVRERNIFDQIEDDDDYDINCDEYEDYLDRNNKNKKVGEEEEEDDDDKDDFDNQDGNVFGNQAVFEYGGGDEFTRSEKITIRRIAKQRAGLVGTMVIPSALGSVTCAACGKNSLDKKQKDYFNKPTSTAFLPCLCCGGSASSGPWYCDDTCRQVDWFLEHRRQCLGINTNTTTTAVSTNTTPTSASTTTKPGIATPSAIHDGTNDGTNDDGSREKRSDKLTAMSRGFGKYTNYWVVDHRFKKAKDMLLTYPKPDHLTIINECNAYYQEQMLSEKKVKDKWAWETSLRNPEIVDQEPISDARKSMRKRRVEKANLKIRKEWNDKFETNIKHQIRTEKIQPLIEDMFDQHVASIVLSQKHELANKIYRQGMANDELIGWEKPRVDKMWLKSMIESNDKRVHFGNEPNRQTSVGHDIGRNYPKPMKKWIKKSGLAAAEDEVEVEVEVHNYTGGVRNDFNKEIGLPSSTWNWSDYAV